MKTQHTKTKTAGCLQPGNKTELAAAWVAFAQPAAGQREYEKLAVMLDQRLRAVHPDGSWIQQREGEVRNNANLMLLESFLRGNRKLIEATLQNNQERIAEEIDRSMLAAVSIQKKRILAQIKSDANRLAEFDEFTIPVYAPEHPSLRRELSNLSPGLMREHFLGAVEDALSSEELSLETAQLIREMADEGMSSAKAARRRRISRNAVRQRLRRAASGINRALERRDFSDLR